MSSRRRGFTLVELLVVVGIVAALVAILMPALNRARKHANRVKCAANLHSIGQALTMYTQRHGYYPGCYIFSRSNVYGLWPVRLRPFLGGDQEVFYCPAQDERCQWKKRLAGPGDVAAVGSFVSLGYEPGEPILVGGNVVDQTWFSYGYNMWGVGDSGNGDTHMRNGLGMGVVPPPVDPNLVSYWASVPAARVKNASEMIAIGDTVADGWWDFSIHPSRGHQPKIWPGRVHDGGANILFCDGHVQWYLQSDLLCDGESGPIPSEEPRRRMWNRNNRPE